MRSTPLFCALLFSAFTAACLPAQQGNEASSATGRIIQPIDDALRTKLPGNIHPLARREFDQGEAPADLPLSRMLMILKRSPQQEAALQRLLEDQQDIHSNAYHQWLTPQQFGERFGPAAADIDAVTQWLTSNGFQVSQISSSRLFIEFSGNAAQIKYAFGTPIHSFAVNGEQHWANVSVPTIPTALATAVAGIDSLHNFQKQAQHISLGTYSAASRKLVSPSPALTMLGGADDEYPLVPYDFAAIYDILPLWNATPIAINGTGQTIAIVGRSDINPADAPSFWSTYGLDGVHAPEPTLVITYNGPNPGKNADETEADIDTQWSGAVAPGATIDFVTSQSTSTTDGVDLSALYIVDNNLAPVMSESYGECETSLGASGIQFYGSLWEQAAAQGISVFVSAGDSGAAGCDNPGGPAQYGLQVNGIASTPYNAAVGGTDFNQYQNWSTYWNSTNAPNTWQSAIGYIPETTWNDSCTNGILALLYGGSTNAEANCNNSAFSSMLDSTGGGGGQSTSWLKPVWQTGTPKDNARDLPDVSLFAGNGFVNSYYFFCQSDGYALGMCDDQGVGGTSVSSPQFAGIMALINQKTGSPQGNPGLTLYKLASRQPTAFHDIPAGSTIAMPCVTGTPNCTTATQYDAYGILSGYSTATGYDLATGLGSVDVANLVNQWQSVSFTPSATTLTLNGGAPVHITHGASVPLRISVTPSTATGEAALMVAPGTPGNPGIAAFPLVSGSVASSIAQLPGGSYSVLAHYGGDSTYGGSYSNSVPVVVSFETSTTFANMVTVDLNSVPLSYSASSATYGSGYQLFRVDVGDANASLSPSTGISSLCASRKESCPTGKVALSVPGTILDGTTLELSSEGYAEVPALSGGTYYGTATYSGDSSFSPSVATVNFTIAKAPTTVSAGAYETPIEYGNMEQISAAASTTSDGIAPTGTFQFFVDGNSVALCTLDESYPYEGISTGKPFYAFIDCSSSTAFMSVGNHTLSAQYSGDVNYAAGASPVSTVSVTQAEPNFSAWVDNPGGDSVIAGQSTTATAQVEGESGTVAPTGTVTFYDSGVALSGTASYTTTVPNSSLNVSMPVVFYTAGTHQITASYSGDSNYTFATSSPAQSLVVLGPVSVTPAGAMTISSPGQTGSTTLSLTPNGGFSGMATLNCAPDPKAKETTCSLTSGSSSGSSLQVNVSGTGLDVTLNVTTTAAQQAARQDTPHFGASPKLALAGLLVLFLPLFKRHRKYFLIIITLALTLGLGACGGGGAASSSGSGGSGGGGSGGGGGGSADPGTPAGSYSYTVTATTGSGSSAITAATQVTVTVN
jgi:hypothetical protein